MTKNVFRVLFYANGSKEKSGIVPIMGRVTINGTVAQFNCKRSIAKEFWDAKSNCVKGKSREARETNLTPDDIEVQIIKHYQRISDREAYVTVEMMRNAYQGHRLKRVRVWDYKQCQQEDSKFVFSADQNRLLSFCWLSHQLKGTIFTGFMCSVIIRSKSSAFNHIVAVFSFGCTPMMDGGIRKSLSRKKCVLCSLSFSMPKGVTDPGVSPKTFFKSFFFAKLNGRVPYVCLNAFKSTRLSPFIVIR